MNEERQMVLQMLADGKITVAEADTLLQALQECEAGPRPAPSPAARRNLSEVVQRAIEKADRALDEAVRSVEERVAEQSRRQPYAKIVELSQSIDGTRRKVEEGGSDVPR